MSSSEEAEFDGGEEEGDEAFVEEEEAEEESSDDDDDAPISSLRNDTPEPSRKRAATKASYKEDSSEGEEADDDDDDAEEESSSDDDDDDVPLSALVAQKPAAKTNGTKKKAAATKKDPPKKKATKAKAKSAAKKKPPPKKKSSTVSNGSSSAKSKSYEWASAALYGTECAKGLLIQRLLCRWWYAFTWPDPTALPVRPPANHDSLDGFPGVYVCTAGEEVGNIQDLRDHDAAPTFSNFARKTAEELRDLLVAALQEQTKQLIAAEGSGTATEKELGSLLKWANKVNVTKAEKEAAKVLKSQGLSL